MIWMRLTVYAIVIPVFIVAPWGLRRPDGLFLALSGASFFALGVILVRRGRRERFRNWLGERRVPRVAELIVWNIVVTVLLLELVLIIAGATTRNPVLMAPNARSHDRINAHRYAGGEIYRGFRLNAGGYHDTEWEKPKPTGTLRVLALGDSFAFGVVDYEDNFLTRLETELTQRLERSVEVVNLGIAGIQPEDYRHLLNEEGLAFEPDIILICLYSGNDFSKRRTGSRLHYANWRLAAVPRRLLRVAREEKARDGVEAARPAGRARERRDRARPPTFTPEAYSAIVARQLELHVRPVTEKIERKFRDTFAILEDIIADASPIPVAVAYLPNELLVNDELREEVCEAHGIDEPKLDLEAPRRRLSEFCVRTKTPLIDLWPAILEVQRAGGAYELRDSHWNVAGNAAAAAALGAGLANEL